MISSAGYRPSQPEEAKKGLKYSVFLFLCIHIFLNFLGYRFSLPVLFLYSVLTNRQSAHFSVATLLILCKQSFFPVFILSCVALGFCGMFAYFVFSFRVPSNFIWYLTVVRSKQFAVLRSLLSILSSKKASNVQCRLQ